MRPKMSRMRHDAEPVVRGYAVTHPPGAPVVLPQPPGWHQLLMALSGVLTVEADTGTWVVPPQRAVWVPDGVHHRLAMTGRVRVRALYLASTLALPDGLDSGCRAVNVPPVLRELVDHAVRRAPLYADRAADERLLGVVLDLLETLPAAPLQLPLPRDRRALDVAAALRDDPAGDQPVDQLARAAGAGRRTIERLFLAETGMSVGTWRQRLRLVAALELLAAGEPVSRVATAVGYSTPSAFGAMFVRHMGTSPGRYFAA
jgi:AraC-like DNA-binding protein